MEPAGATPQRLLGTETTEAAQKATDYRKATPSAARRPRGCVTWWSRAHQSQKRFKKISRHLFGLQEVFFTFSRARCLPLLERAWARTAHIRPQEFVTRTQEGFATASPGWGWL